MKLIKKASILIGTSALVLTLFFFAKNDSEIVSSEIYQDKQVVENYKNYCASCHGDKLEKFADREWMFANSPEDISKIISQGEPDMGMPAFNETFTKKEIEELTRYIVGASKKRAMVEEEALAKASDKASKTTFRVETIVSNLNSPWGLEFLPNGDLLIAERNGTLSRFTSDKKLIKLSGLPEIRVGGQGGLMDLQLHPNYAENGWVYISYSYFDEADNSKGNTAIIRARIKEDKLIDVETLYLGTPTVSARHHYGSRIEFDKEGYVYFSIGDRGNRDEYPQKTDNSNGKVHRLFDDGRIPPDNPFVGDKKAEQSIYSYGHRNVQGIAMHPVSGEIWTHEHGPKGGDEVNIIEKGQNYGWPIISYGRNYSGTKFTNITSKKGMLQPVIYYVPSIAPCGMAFVTGDKFPGWKNNLLIGSLRFQYLERCVVENNKIVQQERLLEDVGRVRNVKLGPQGYIYVAVEEPGKILKLIPTSDE